MKLRITWIAVAALLAAAGSGFAGGASDGQGAAGTATTTTATVPAGQYNESPMLAALVAAGELPPVDERLPIEPLVVTPTEGIGKYGGTLQDAHLSGNYYQTNNDSFVTLDVDLTTPVASIIKSWEWDDDGMGLTYRLREGMRWSDGEPMTADDYLFWWEDVFMNDELTPTKSSHFQIGGELANMRKIDDYTIKWEFPNPYGYFVTRAANWGMRNTHIARPKHYLQQFHPKYASQADLDRHMKEQQVDTWVDLFGLMDDWENSTERPSYLAWVNQNDMTQPIQVLERNPYYWKVDTAGNQLPYIDRMERTLVTDREALLLKGIAGEIDILKIAWVGVENYGLIVQNQERGDYHLQENWLAPYNTGTIMVNPHHGDPVVRQVLSDLRFRQALSIGIDRDEINDLAFLGSAIPSQVAPSPGPPYFGDGPLYQEFLEYDPARANQLLDQMGLTARDSEGYRLAPDGSPLFLVINTNTGWPAITVEVSELYKQYWDELGLKMTVKAEPNNIVYPRLENNDYDIFVRAYISGGVVQPPPTGYVFPSGRRWHTAPLWGQWISSGGSQGEEPPAWILQLLEIQDEALSTRDEDRRAELWQESMRLHIENLLPIGGFQIGGPGHPNNATIIHNRLHNVPDPADGHFIAAQRETWYLDPQ